MSLGTELKLPLLERFHLYRLGDRMTEKDANIFVEHKEYVIIWQRFMPNLRDVVLSPDVRWIRNDCIPPSTPVTPPHVTSVGNSRESPALFDMLEIRNLRRRTQQASSQWHRCPILPKALDGIEGLQVIPCPMTNSTSRLDAADKKRQVDFISKAHLSSPPAPAIPGHQAPAFGHGPQHMATQWNMTAHALQHAQVHFFQQAAAHAGHVGNEDMLMLDDALNDVPHLVPHNEVLGEVMGELMGELTGDLDQMAVWMQ